MGTRWRNLEHRPYGKRMFLWGHDTDSWTLPYHPVIEKQEGDGRPFEIRYLFDLVPVSPGAIRIERCGPHLGDGPFTPIYYLLFGSIKPIRMDLILKILYLGPLYSSMSSVGEDTILVWPSILTSLEEQNPRVLTPSGRYRTSTSPDRYLIQHPVYGIYDRQELVLNYR